VPRQRSPQPLTETCIASPANTFYKNVFDWTFKEPSASASSDTASKVRLFDFRPSVEFSGGLQQVPVAEYPDGLFTTGGGKLGGPCLYWMVEDLGKIAAKIEAEGGKMRSEPVKEGESGLYRFFEDTEGNVSAVYQWSGMGAS
jgi:predicted enzyme related to lactoylglutathione lyase